MLCLNLVFLFLRVLPPPRPSSVPNHHITHSTLVMAQNLYQSHNKTSYEDDDLSNVTSQAIPVDHNTTSIKNGKYF